MVLPVFFKICEMLFHLIRPHKHPSMPHIGVGTRAGTGILRRRYAAHYYIWYSQPMASPANARLAHRLFSCAAMRHFASPQAMLPYALRACNGCEISCPRWWRYRHCSAACLTAMLHAAPLLPGYIILPNWRTQKNGPAG